MTLVKICGIRDIETAQVAVEAGADFVGLVFFDRSPRNIGIEDAHDIARTIPVTVETVGLMVDPSDFELNLILNAVDLTMIQLHGNETPERIAEIRMTFGLPVMKALRIASMADVEAARTFEDAADWLLFDAAPPKGADRPGGNGHVFDWSLLAGQTWQKPCMLSGGLDETNVAAAIAAINPAGVDVSSGVEDSPGLKNPDKIRRFIAAAKGLP